MKFLGVDWGLTRIGLAISEGVLASPYKTLEVKNLDQALSKLLGVLESENIDQVVIGKPEGGMGKKVEKLVKKLKSLGLNVVETDETLSSQQAQQEMINLGVSQKKRGDDNSVAAAIILQEFLDEINQKN